MKQTTQDDKSGGAGCKSGQQCGRMMKVANFVKTGYYASLSPDGKKSWADWRVEERLNFVLSIEKQHNVTF